MNDVTWIDGRTRWPVALGWPLPVGTHTVNMVGILDLDMEFPGSAEWRVGDALAEKLLGRLTDLIDPTDGQPAPIFGVKVMSVKSTRSRMMAQAGDICRISVVLTSSWDVESVTFGGYTVTHYTPEMVIAQIRDALDVYLVALDANAEFNSTSVVGETRY